MDSKDIATILVSVIAAIGSAAAAYLSNRSKNVSTGLERRMKIRQARMDERDLILEEQGFLIPVEDDEMWRKYFELMDDGSLTRKKASEKVKHKTPPAPKSIIKEKLK